MCPEPVLLQYGFNAVWGGLRIQHLAADNAIVIDSRQNSSSATLQGICYEYFIALWEGHAKTPSQLWAHLHFVHSHWIFQRLSISVDCPKLHALFMWNLVVTIVYSDETCHSLPAPMLWSNSKLCSTLNAEFWAPRQIYHWQIDFCYSSQRLTWRPLFIILFTAFPPPPPTPITFIRASPPDDGLNIRVAPDRQSSEYLLIQILRLCWWQRNDIDH